MANTPSQTFNKKTAVILFQLGGPDSLEAIEPFLHNLFMDPDIIDFPLAFLARRPLAKFISSKRAPKVQENYKQIGGKSPILELTRRQATALELQLHQHGVDAAVFIAMRYWHPMTNRAVQEVKAGAFEQVILLPLYPQFSQATTFSSFNEWNRQAKRAGLNIPTKTICCYPSHPHLIEALVQNINLALTRFRNIPPGDIDLVFSAHGIPVSYIQKGDPYQLQIEETVRAICEEGKWTTPYTLCYQSKVGPMEWLKPSLVETVQRLGTAGRKNLLVIPVAFVTDHIETLHEINIDVRKEAAHLGIQQFELAPALNDHPQFIECLTELTLAQLTHTQQSDTCSLLWKQKNSRPRPKLCPGIRYAEKLR
jgi:protoporphyrin/coproporphyrin ferrochelatase